MNISVAFTWDLYCFTSIHKKCCCPQGIYGFNISGIPTSAGHHKAKQKPSTPEIQNSHSSPAHDLLPGLGVLSVNLKREKRANNRRKCYFVFRSDRILINPNLLLSVQIAQDEPLMTHPEHCHQRHHHRHHPRCQYHIMGHHPNTVIPGATIPDVVISDFQSWI